MILTSSKASGYFVVTNGHVIDGTPIDSISIHLHDGRTIQPDKIWTDEAVPAWYRQNAILYLDDATADSLGLSPSDPALLDRVHPAFWARANRELKYANALPESEVLRQQAQQQQ